jgi:transposase-like protein
MASAFNDPRFHDEAAAFAALEEIMWPAGQPPCCPHCGVIDRMNRLGVQTSKPSKKNPEGKPVHGLWKCYACRKQFTVRKGTIFEESRLELHLWFQAAFLMCSSKKGVSANQLHRTLGCTIRTAWFLAHRLRTAMAPAVATQMGGENAIIEADTTYWGPKEKNKHAWQRNPKNIGGAGKQIIHTLVERGGAARSHHVPNVSGETLRPILFGNVDKKSALMTDTHGGYLHAGKKFARHEMVDHGAGEYVRGDAYSNTVEGFFSIFKRGMTGIYQHCSEKHLHRYLAEFDFRYSNRIALGINDAARTSKMLKGAAGKRLTYRA